MSPGLEYSPAKDFPEAETEADFSYSTIVSVIDTNLGRRSVTNDIEAVLRKIEYWHQGSVAGYRIMYRGSEGIWDGVRWDGKSATFLSLREGDEKKAMAKLLTL